MEEGNQSDPSPTGIESEQKVCPYFLKGTCRQLTNCKWLHPADAGSPQANESKLCPYFASGRCNHGNSCKWIHPISPKDQMCPHYAVGKCFYGNNCKYKHPGQLPTNLQGYYPLAYDQQSAMMLNHAMAYPNPMISHSLPPNLAPFARFASSSDEKKICKYWQEGNCHFENCRFPHIGPAGGGLTVQFSVQNFNPKPTEDTTGKVCRYWAKGSCHFEHCRFPHVGPAGSGTADPSQQQKVSNDSL